MNKISCRQNHTIDKTEWIFVDIAVVAVINTDGWLLYQYNDDDALNVDHRNQITTDFTMNRNDSFVHI